MPYIDPKFRPAIDAGVDGVQTVGDLNYFLSCIISRMWKVHPSYMTIHELRRELVTEPKNSKLLNQLRSALADRFTVADIYTAAAEAYHEFRNRIGTPYEALKCRLNGDVPGYTESVSDILTKLAEHEKQREASQIIVPGSK